MTDSVSLTSVVVERCPRSAAVSARVQSSVSLMLGRLLQVELPDALDERDDVGRELLADARHLEA
mgnify:CR=1 FL=1